MSIIKFTDYVTEGNDNKYSYGIAMCKFKLPNWEEILLEIDKKIYSSVIV